MDDTTDDNVVSIDTRNQKGQFVKGQSGNPLGGNRKTLSKAAQKRTVQDLMDANAPKVMVCLIAIIEDKEASAAARVSAIKEYHDRFFGKARTGTIIKAHDNAEEEVDLTDVPLEMLRAIANLVK